MPRFTRSRKAAGNVPYEHERIGDDNKTAVKGSFNMDSSQSANWLKAIDDIQGLVDSNICNPDNIEPIDCSLLGLNFDTGKLPEDIHKSLYAKFRARDNSTHVFDKWVQHNYSTLSEWSFGKYLEENNSPKWEDTIQGPINGENWIKGGQAEFN
ncbi:hypothetical protein B0J17DRAFT_633372 [Rhizoctonia solani]|nr:hypothetical protein B0J17DRAFT_633372 [Rhizoctonia solani]